MSWVGPAAKEGAKLAVKYGPHVKTAWDVGGDKVKEAARAKAAEITNRRKAFEDAQARRVGSVLKVPQSSGPVFVVFAGDEPVASYPSVDTPLTDLVRNVDLGKRLTPAAFKEQQLKTKALKAAKKVTTKAPGQASRSIRRD